MKKLCKSKSDKKIDGVCAGIANYFGIDSTVVRVLFVVSLFFGLTGGIIYIVCMLVMPVESDIIDIDDFNKNN